jgi:deazaflavin-dependent oxidoreductase (nitroreductase family)
MVVKVLEEPRWTPPRWLNSMMIVMLRTPGLQKVVGRSTALLTFEGRKTGRTFVTPISYLRAGNDVYLTGHHQRMWWRNLEVNPRVRIRLGGREYSGIARVEFGTDEALAVLIQFLEEQPAVAKVSGVEMDDQGHVNIEDARVVAEFTVVVTITLDG